MDMRTEDANVILVRLLEGAVLHGHGQIAAGSASASDTKFTFKYIYSDQGESSFNLPGHQFVVRRLHKHLYGLLAVP